MEHYLDCLLRFVTELRNTNSRILKEEILAKWWKEYLDTYTKNNDNEPLASLLNLFRYVYNYDTQFYITSANILKKDLTEKGLFAGKNYSLLWDLLEDLSNRVITGHQAIMAVQQFLKKHTESQQKLILDIIDKDLKCGLSEVTINKVCGNIIKTYNVALADKFNPKKHILNSDWVIERKLDGVRCNVINRDGIIKCYSRQGKEITTLGKLVDELQGHLPDNTVLDGEVCLVDKNGLESFQGIMKEIKRKDHTIENPLLLAFDMLTLQEFEAKEGNTKYTDRMKRLKEWYELQNWGIGPNKVAKHLSIVNYEFYSPKVLEEWNERVKKYHWEGLMFRKDTGYEGKRTSNLLKNKMFMDEEFKVLAVEEGDAQELIDGKMVKIKCVGSLVIEYKGNKVNVGTGLSLEQRKRWYTNPEEIVGKTITVKFFEPTQNQDGSWSLRFPVLKTIYEGERDI